MSRPKIVIDARMVGPTLHGIARYVSLLALGLSEIKDLPYEPIFLVAPGIKMAGHTVRETGSRFLSVGEQWAVPKLLREIGATLYHSPSFSSLLYCPCPWLVTLHDLNHLSFGGIAEKIYYRAVLKPFALKAKELLTVSEFSRQEIAAWMGIPRDSIEVVFNALDPAFKTPPSNPEIDAVLKGLRLERGKYFFCLSNSKPHKNVALLAEAYLTFRNQSLAPQVWPLVLSTKGIVQAAARQGVVEVDSLRETHVRALLAGAGALVFPSLYEGFGLPPAEAAALGIPVIASRIHAHEEALRDLTMEEVHWVEPRDFHGWVNALHRGQRGDVRGACAETRAKILERYSVGELARHMDQIYRRALG